MLRPARRLPIRMTEIPALTGTNEPADQLAIDERREPARRTPSTTDTTRSNDRPPTPPPSHMTLAIQKPLKRPPSNQTTHLATERLVLHLRHEPPVTPRPRTLPLRPPRRHEPARPIWYATPRTPQRTEPLLPGSRRILPPTAIADPHQPVPPGSGRPALSGGEMASALWGEGGFVKNRLLSGSPSKPFPFPM